MAMLDEAVGAGSPPQVRGKLRLHRQEVTPIRITPAGAGKTAKAPATANLRWDHPRRCGENTKKIL